MDVALVAATAVGTSYLPRHFLHGTTSTTSNASTNNSNHGNSPSLPSSSSSFSEQNNNPQSLSYFWTGAHSAHSAGPLVTLSLALSLSLFALACLEAAPASWLALWWMQSEAGIAAAYGTVFWIMAAVVVVFIPSCCGTQILAQRAYALDQSVDHEERKKLSFKPVIKAGHEHWALRFLYKLVSVLSRVVVYSVYYVLIAPIYYAVISPLNQMLCHRRKEKGSSVLPMTNKNNHNTDRRETPEEPRSAAGTWTGSCFSTSTLKRASPFVLFLRDASFRRFTILGSLGGTLLVCAVLAAVTPFVVETSSNSPLVRSVSWLCATGILLSAVLNGFGSVSLPYSCLAGLFLQPVHPDAIANAEIELEQARASLKDRRQEMKNLTVTVLPASSSSNRSLRSSSSFSSKWSLRRVMGGVGRHRFSDWGDEVSQRKQQLQVEIDFVEALIDEMAQDVEEMRYSQQVSARARTTEGRIRSWIGVVFSVVLLVRLSSAVSSVWHQYHFGFVEHRSGADPITRILLWLLGHRFVSQGDLHTLSQFISLLLTAFLSFSQLRNFLRTATKLHRRVGNLYRRCYCKPKCIATRSPLSSSDSTPNSSPSKQQQQSTVFEMTSIASEYLFSHLVAALMCCYCLACVVLTKMMLPFEYRTGFSAALGVVEQHGTGEIFSIRTYAVNFLFSMTALLSAVVLVVLLGIMRTNARRYESTLDPRTAAAVKRVPSILEATSRCSLTEP